MMNKPTHEAYYDYRDIKRYLASKYPNMNWEAYFDNVKEHNEISSNGVFINIIRECYGDLELESEDEFDEWTRPFCKIILQEFPDLSWSCDKGPTSVYFWW